MIVEATKKIVEKIDLTSDEAEQVMDEIMSGRQSRSIWHRFSRRFA